MLFWKSHDAHVILFFYAFQQRLNAHQTASYAAQYTRSKASSLLIVSTYFIIIVSLIWPPYPDFLEI